MENFLHLSPKRIGIFRALQLGDLLCAIPAIRALKNYFPDAELTLIGLPWARDFVKIFSAYFSDFMHFPGYPGIIEQPFRTDMFINFLKEANTKQFDLVIQLHGNGSVINPMISMLGAKRTAGFFEAGRYKPDHDFFMEYPEGLPESERHLKLIDFLGIPVNERELEFPVSQKDFSEYRILQHSYGINQEKYICLHSGARDKRRWWGRDNFVKIANWFGERGFQIVLTGTEGEAELVKEVENVIDYPLVNLAGKTTLAQLACLLKRSVMLFSNDTGVSHMAAALQVPSIIIFLASDPKRWAPLNRNIHKVILPDEAGDLEYIKENIETLLQDTWRGEYVLL